jgi:pimeloyl-ACP methyl ester carboxylesterase
LQDNYIRVNGLNIRYWKAGRGSPVILIHGLAGSIELWANNIEPIARQHMVYAFDLPWCGLSDKPRLTPSLGYTVEFVKDFMSSQSLERTTLIASSLGGAVCMQFAIQFPDRVDKLILANSAALGQEVHFILRLMSVPFLGELMSKTSKRGSKTFLEQAVFYDSKFVTDEWLDEIFKVAKTKEARISSFIINRTSIDFRGQRLNKIMPIINKLPQIRASTLIVWGAQDKVIPVAHAYVGLRMIPDARLQIFEECGHLPMIEKADKFNKLVLDFLA